MIQSFLWNALYFRLIDHLASAIFKGNKFTGSILPDFNNSCFIGSINYFDVEKQASMQVFDQISFNNTACSVEYNSLLDLYAVGTYELVETKTNEQGLINHQERQGECILYDCKDRKFNVIDRKSTPGTLDIKWMKDFMAVVDAKGYLSIDKYENKKLKQLSLVDCKSDNQSLALSLDWSNSRKEVEPMVAVSMSDGRALTVNSATEQVLVDWQAHDYETWIAAWDHYKPNDIIYTGADDCIFKCWDLRTGVDTPIASNKRCVLSL